MTLDWNDSDMGAGPVNDRDASPFGANRHLRHLLEFEDDALPVPAKRSAPCMAEALPFQGGYRPPSRSFKDENRMPEIDRFGCIATSTGV